MGFDHLFESERNGVKTKSGRVKVVLDVPIEVTNYHGDEVTDDEVREAAVQAIQEGKGRVERIE